MGGAADILHDERGFTLIELLVAMIAGIVVISALFTILDVTLHQTTRTFSKVDATQRARTTFSLLENELHSSCIGNQTAPIQQNSDGNTLMFLSQYGSAATVTPAWHTVSFNSASGTLTDATYSATLNQSSGDWTPSGTPSTRTLLTNVNQSSLPVFEYYAYGVPLNSSNQPYQDASGNQYEMLLDGTSTVPGTATFPANAPAPNGAPLTTPLSSSDADAAAEVRITLVVGPQGGTGENTSQGAGTVNDSIVMRFTPVANHDGPNQDFSPCE